MKVLCVIDSLGSGGAQRQMVNLACGLRLKGHEVEMFVYFPEARFFRTLVEDVGIRVHEMTKGPGFSLAVVSRLVALFRSHDGAVSFMKSPNVYCELASLFAPRLRLIVSERGSFNAGGSVLGSTALGLLHLAADAVVANSASQAAWLRGKFWLRGKTHTIYNGYPMPGRPVRQVSDTETPFRYLVVGRIHHAKNGVRLVQALVRYHARHGRCPLVSWVGRRETDPLSLEHGRQMERLLEAHPGVAANWQWLGERNDVPALLESHDALIHPSLHEGLPNVVCEAFVAARPVLASNVCDHPILIGEGERGVLFDPLSIEAICCAIERFEALSTGDRMQMGENARLFAENNLSVQCMVDAYEALLHSRDASRRTKCSVPVQWVGRDKTAPAAAPDKVGDEGRADGPACTS